MRLNAAGRMLTPEQWFRLRALGTAVEYGISGAAYDNPATGRVDPQTAAAHRSTARTYRGLARRARRADYR